MSSKEAWRCSHTPFGWPPGAAGVSLWERGAQGRWAHADEGRDCGGTRQPREAIRTEGGGLGPVLPQSMEKTSPVPGGARTSALQAVMA